MSNVVDDFVRAQRRMKAAEQDVLDSDDDSIPVQKHKLDLLREKIAMCKESGNKFLNEKDKPENSGLSLSKFASKIGATEGDALRVILRMSRKAWVRSPRD